MSVCILQPERDRSPSAERDSIRVGGGSPLASVTAHSRSLHHNDYDDDQWYRLPQKKITKTTTTTPTTAAVAACIQPRTKRIVCGHWIANRNLQFEPPKQKFKVTDIISSDVDKLSITEDRNHAELLSWLEASLGLSGWERRPAGPWTSQGGVVGLFAGNSQAATMHH